MAYRATVFIAILLIAIAAGLFVRQTEKDAIAAGKLWPGPAELRAQDTLMAAKPAEKPHPDVLVVAADEASLQRYGKTPGRDVWAAALRRVQEGGAKAAIFDIALDERTSKSADTALWRTVANGRRTVVGLGYNADKKTWTPDDLGALRFLERDALADNVILRGTAATTAFTWPNFDAPVYDFSQSARGAGVFVRETDQDGIIRHARMLYRSQVTPPPAVTGSVSGRNFPQSKLNGFEVVLPSLPLAGALRAFDLDKTAVRVDNDSIRFASRLDPTVVIPIDAAGRMAINYPGPYGAIPTVSLAEVAAGKTPAATFKDKVVVFGVTAPGSDTGDIRKTPKGEMPRVHITAAAVSNILARNYLARSRSNDVLAILLGVGAVAGLLLSRRSPGRVFVTGLLLGVLYFAIAWGALTFGHVIMPVLPALGVLGIATLIAAALAYYFETVRTRVPATV